jgi:hypothetical protein
MPITKRITKTTLFEQYYLFFGQSEGAVHIDGKGLSIWDTFTKEHPGLSLSLSLSLSVFLRFPQIILHVCLMAL